MKLSAWDLLSAVALLSAALVGLILLSIFNDPLSPLNPFPPYNLPTRIVLPTGTPTPPRLPDVWTVTPTGNSGVQDLRPSSTLPPSPTGFLVPSFTPSPTMTYTPSITPTRTRTRIPPTLTITPNKTATALSKFATAQKKTSVYLTKRAKTQLPQ